MSLNQPFDEKYSELLFRFHEYLRAQHAEKRRTLLIVDEAQNLQPDALESLRMLSNINADKDQFLQLILVGQPQLKELLRSPELAQFAQRISVDFHLKPFNAGEVTQYIDYRLKAVGARDPLFSNEACAAIAQASAGIPRAINILCDTALVYALPANLVALPSKSSISSSKTNEVSAYLVNEALCRYSRFERKKCKLTRPRPFPRRFSRGERNSLSPPMSYPD